MRMRFATRDETKQTETNERARRARCMLWLDAHATLSEIRRAYLGERARMDYRYCTFVYEFRGGGIVRVDRDARNAARRRSAYAA